MSIITYYTYIHIYTFYIYKYIWVLSYMLMYDSYFHLHCSIDPTPTRPLSTSWSVSQSLGHKDRRVASITERNSTKWIDALRF